MLDCYFIELFNISIWIFPNLNHISLNYLIHTPLKRKKCVRFSNYTHSNCYQTVVCQRLQVVAFITPIFAPFFYGYFPKIFTNLTKTTDSFYQLNFINSRLNTPYFSKNNDLLIDYKKKKENN